jgi:hypothetical protein
MTSVTYEFAQKFELPIKVVVQPRLEEQGLASIL